MAREGALPARERSRPPRGSRHAPRRRRQHLPGPQRAVQPDDDLPARPERGVVRRQPRQVLPRRGAHDGREDGGARVTETNEPAPTAKVTIDGRVFEAQPGELLIKVAQDNGVYIPRFCWHERMKPVGMCRMCLVQIEGVRGYPPACTTTVTDGMAVDTTSATVEKIQDGVLEFLLINHPLDCPVCDR